MIGLLKIKEVKIMAKFNMKERVSLIMDALLNRAEEMRCVRCGDAAVIPRTVSETCKRKFGTGFCNACATISLLRDPD